MSFQSGQKMSRADSVKDFLKNLKHPQKKEIEEIRKIILSSNKSLTEQIKWNAPSFCFNCDDRITFNLTGKGVVRLIFHCGARVKDNKAKTRLFEDKTGLLKWASNDRAIATFTDMSDVMKKKEDLISVVQIWLSLTT